SGVIHAHSRMRRESLRCVRDAPRPTFHLARERGSAQGCTTQGRLMPRVVLIGAFGFAAFAVATTGSGLSAPGRVVPCSEIIDYTKFPYLGGYQRQFRYRLVLDVISVPPAYMEQVVPTRSTPW